MTNKNSAPKTDTALSGISSGLILLMLLIGATLIGSVGVALVGRVLMLFFAMSQFEASLIALGTALVILLSFVQILRPPVISNFYDEDDFEDWEDEESADADRVEEKIIPPPGRNDPCPCGSGRKYKNCHGR